MSLFSLIKSYNSFNFNEFQNTVDGNRIERILDKRGLDIMDFLCLLSKNASNNLEEMAQIAHENTKKYFGNVIQIFTPLYLSNYCDNKCRYCSFANHQKIKRKKLSLDEIRTEAEIISKSGMRNILILTGESRSMTPVNYIKSSIEVLGEYFSSIGIEIYPLTGDEYLELIRSGVDSLTIYQEVYDRKIYSNLHDRGPKADYEFRLDAPERALQQNIRKVNIGTLLGLGNPVKEIFFTGLHMQYLQKKYPWAEFSVSLPRIRPLVSEFKPEFQISDALFVQILTALRIWNPSLGITISTRESQNFRNNILKLGVTRMSAGVSTAVGGHSSNSSANQFEISDLRSLPEIQCDLLKMGYQPVLHDWNIKMSVLS
ncbi:MAG: 2-iminoacetate synthase ThiH [bacterium]